MTEPGTRFVDGLGWEFEVIDTPSPSEDVIPGILHWVGPPDPDFDIPTQYVFMLKLALDLWTEVS